MSQLLQYYKNFQAAHFPPRNPLPNLTPTFEDLSIDENLTELQRLVKYARSSIGLQRLVHVKMMFSIAASVGFDDTKSKIIPILEGLSHDTEPAVRQHFVEQLSALAKFCANHGEDGYQIVVTKILPLTARLLEDDKAEVRQAACTSLVSLASIIRLDDIGQYVLTIILRLAHEDDKEESRMTAAELLNSLAETLGHDLCKQFVIPEVVSLAEDPAFRVRKATALNFHFVCKTGGEHELFERLMPAFVRLSKDDMYRVRRACAESLSEISKYVSDDIRIGVLVEIFLRLSQDQYRVVKQSVLQQSGMFISTLPCQYVNENILTQFSSMASSPIGDAQVDLELKHYCAYSFPAVLLTIGSARWKSVRPLYQTLVKCNSPSVKQTLAASLHEIAKILGNPALVEEELLPVFEQFIQDVEDVQMGVIKHLAEFLNMLSVPCRLSFLPMLQDILNSTNPFNWRLRQCLALQLPELIELPPVENLYSSLYPLITSLLQDSIVSVRRCSYTGVAKLINVLEAETVRESRAAENPEKPLISEAQLEDVANIINMLAHGDSYNMRLVWVELCHCLLKQLSQSLFEKYFIEGILLLTSDRTTNIRIAVASLLAGFDPKAAPWDSPVKPAADDNNSSSSSSSTAADQPTSVESSSPWTWLLGRYDIQQCVLRLARDDRDVVVKVRRLQPMFPEITFTEISCRGYLAAPGGAIPVPLCKYNPEGKNRMVFNYIAAASGGDALDEGDNESVDAHCPDRGSSISSHSDDHDHAAAGDDDDSSEKILNELSSTAAAAPASDSDVPAIDLETDIVLGNLEEQELYRGKQRVFTGHESNGEDGEEVQPGIKPSHATMRFDEISLPQDQQDNQAK